MTAKEARQVIRELLIAYAENKTEYLSNEDAVIYITPTPIEWEAMARLVDYKL